MVIKEKESGNGERERREERRGIQMARSIEKDEENFSSLSLSPSRLLHLFDLALDRGRQRRVIVECWSWR